MNTALLASWGYTDADIVRAVVELRAATKSERTGPPTAGEVSLVELCLVCDILQREGYETRVRWEKH